MVEFKKNAKKALPYDRGQYIEFLKDDDFPSLAKWYGVSFQLASERKELSLTKFVDKYEFWFKNIISSFDNGLLWIVNHDKVDQNWFPNDEDNLTTLRDLFRQNNISNKFRGALIFSKEGLLKFSEDLISYPYAVFNKDGKFYTDIDISHSELPFIIKILDHLNIDLLSTDKELLRKVVNENSSNLFTVKEYIGTSL